MYRLSNRFFDRRREVHVVDSEETRARIENTRLEPGPRQLYERVRSRTVIGLWRRNNLPNKLATRVRR